MQKRGGGGFALGSKNGYNSKSMKQERGRAVEIVVLDSYCVREGDLDWSPLYALADRVTLWPRTPRGELAQRIGGPSA